MPLDPATLLALASTCAPQVAADTLQALVRVESGFDPLAIGVNGRRPARLAPHDLQEAVATATALLMQGKNLDLGLGQINARNLAPLGLSVAEAFDPCRNLAAAAKVLRSDWRSTRATAPTPLGALQATLSRYNTGSPSRGLRNGYAAKVAAAARVAMTGVVGPPARGPSAAAPQWLVFGGRPSTAFVITPPEDPRP